MARTSPVLGGRALMEGTRSKNELVGFAAVGADEQGKKSGARASISTEYGAKSSAKGPWKA